MLQKRSRLTHGSPLNRGSNLDRGSPVDRGSHSRKTVENFGELEICEGRDNHFVDRVVPLRVHQITRKHVKTEKSRDQDSKRCLILRFMRSAYLNGIDAKVIDLITWILTGSVFV